MTVETYQQYQETVEAAVNMLCQLKQRTDQLAIDIILCQLNKWYDEMDIPYVEEVAHVSRYPLLESMNFDTGISGLVTKNRAATLLGDLSASTNTLKPR